jgi:hypothetical protein
MLDGNKRTNEKRGEAWRSVEKAEICFFTGDVGYRTTGHKRNKNITD